MRNCTDLHLTLRYTKGNEFVYNINSGCKISLGIQPKPSKVELDKKDFEVSQGSIPRTQVSLSDFRNFLHEFVRKRKGRYAQAK